MQSKQTRNLQHWDDDDQLVKLLGQLAVRRLSDL